MWMLVMFDLPVDTSENRKAATDFRERLLDFGFDRCQFSCYMRFVEGREQADTWTRRIEQAVPDGGKVYVLFLRPRISLDT